MSLRITLATLRRVLRQLRHDPRTVALLLVVPSGLMTLLRLVYEHQPQVFDHVGAPLLAIFPFTTMFVVTSVAMLRERTTGTLERLLSMPTHKLDLLAGYAGAFAIVALLQVGVASLVSLAWLGLDVQGSTALVLVVALLDALLGTALGLFLSAFARTEFQAVQFLPAAVLPQLIVCGLFLPRGQLSTPLRLLSNVLPLSYAVDAIQRVARSSGLDATLRQDIVVLALFVVGLLAVGAATLRRRTP
jgi:ABC-2 type transport system permease protein